MHSSTRNAMTLFSSVRVIFSRSYKSLASVVSIEAFMFLRLNDFKAGGIGLVSQRYLYVRGRDTVRSIVPESKSLEILVSPKLS